MLKIRLRRMGAIRQPHYRIVVADARAPRDGDFIESLGHYNPLTNPATIQIDLAKYEDWKRKGAQPTDAVVSLVSQLNKATATSAEGAAQPADRRTRTASGKRAIPEVTASAPAPAPAEEAAPATEEAAPAAVEEAPAAPAEEAAPAVDAAEEAAPAAGDEA